MPLECKSMKILGVQVLQMGIWLGIAVHQAVQICIHVRPNHQMK